ncbi:Hypothetical predicted protein [Prunus dulcis]|uniref:Uncharacterized protein n=1 Tax=Prunus dulcis TaxID=3755 RepID=A0A5E4FJ31_PRUDU|nr:Hypothetical predicted protein [Prunus dulcis]
MSNSFFQPSTFDLSDDRHQGMPNRFSAYVPANYVTEEQEKFRQAAAAVAAMHFLRLPNPNPAATTHQNPNSTVRRVSNFKTQPGVRQESRIHKPQPQHIYNNHHHHPRSNSHEDFMVYKSQNQNHQSRNQNAYAAPSASPSALQKYSQAQAHYQFAMQQQVEHAFRLVVSGIGLPSLTYNPMLLSSQPAVATTLTMGLSGELSQQQQHQQASNFVNFVGHKNMNPIQPPHNPTTRTLTLEEMDDGGNQQDGLDLSLRL